MKKIHLLCNAHLDPVWLWRKDEGAAEALSTFRIAADFCEQNKAFIFNHNEAVVYQWVEEYDTDLFKRIQALVEKDKWHIMGGWYLQPDCNMPSGEAMVRQILEGRKYFLDKFGKYPTTAINFDSFGHSRGLVQIMKKSGYDSYVFGRPFDKDCKLPGEDFVWSGLDGSEIIANRAYDHYLTLKGEAVAKIEKWIAESKEDSLGLILWGVGNHGGGPSAVDIKSIDELMRKSEHIISHSTPEQYFGELAASGKELPSFSQPLNSWAVGCYTSQIRIKQTYRELENQYFVTEKMAAMASLNELIEYPEKELSEARKDMLFCQFHDILPGSSIKSAEDDAIRMMDHGLEILSRLKTRIFMLMSKNEEPGDENNLPIFVYNPHPYKTTEIIGCEFQLANQNWGDDITIPVVYQNGKEISSQLEKEASNLNLDWRKNIVFSAELEPMSINRFQCRFMRREKPDDLMLEKKGKSYTFNNGLLSVSFDCKTGLIENISVDGITYIDDSIKFCIMNDDENPWGSHVKEFNETIGEFELMSREEGSIFSGINNKQIESIRMIEDGAVRSVIECVYKYCDSKTAVKYKLPKKGTEIEIEASVFWNEKDKMLKLMVPFAMDEYEARGQIMYGSEKLETNGQEMVAQKWIGVFSRKHNKAVSIINKGNYGSHFIDSSMNVTLLRSPAYAALPIKERPIMRQDRFSDRIDQGKRCFRFWMNFGGERERMDNIDREAAEHNEASYALSFYPSGGKKRNYSYLRVSNKNVQVSGLKKSENSCDMIVRLFNPLELRTNTSVRFYNISEKNYCVELEPFEIKTCVYCKEKDEWGTTDLMENMGHKH